MTPIFREPVYAAHDGIVSELNTERERGLGVALTTLYPYDYGPAQYHFKSRYWHFDEIVVSIGQRVEVGNLLGYSNSTGYSTGHHLHFELKPLRKEAGIYVNLEQENGFYGAIDPLPYIVEVDAPDRRKQLDSFGYQLKLIAEKIKWLFSQIKK